MCKENTIYIDITNEWLKDVDKNKSKKIVKEAKYIVKGGKIYYTNNINKIIYMNNERENGLWYVKLMGGTLLYLPTISENGGISCADYLYISSDNKLKYFLEEKETFGKGKNAFYHALEDKENQSNIFLIDCTKSNLTRKEINQRINIVFKSKKTSYVEVLIIKNGDKLYWVFSKQK